MPLSGKIPTTKGWRKWPRENLEQAVKYAENNIGIRTGRSSNGLVVVDIDGIPRPDNLPQTVMVQSRPGRFHLYYHSNYEIRNSESKIMPGLDIRGEGGYIVAAGSIHPETGDEYHYLLSPTDTPIAELPDWIIEAVTDPITLPDTERDAMERAIEELAAAPKGTRNSTLNRLAYWLCGFSIPHKLIRERLLAATTLPTREATTTIDSALKSRPRPAIQEYVLVPGTHQTDQTTFVETGVHEFAADVLSRVPDNLIYQRGGIPVELLQDALSPIHTNKMRLLLDSNMRFAQWVKSTRQFRHASRDYAQLVLAAIPGHCNVPDIRMFTTYPIFTKRWELAKPGWHAGVYYHQPYELENIPLHTDTAVIDDILIDFPWSTEADRQNFIACMITPIVRYALTGNVPMFLIKASIERTGKTKLAEEVMGGLFFRSHTPAMQLTKDENERDKRIISLLLRGDTILHLDNISGYVDSPSLASLITSTTYRGRILGGSTMMDAENNLILIGTGNNPKATGEIVRRIVPITLQPANDHPETRSDFKHPMCFQYVCEQRVRVLGCLIGLVDRWITAGRKPGALRLGGFEDWAACISGVMSSAGYAEFMDNWKDWVKNANPERSELAEFCATWWNMHSNLPVATKQLLAIAEEEALFSDILTRSPNEQGKCTILGRSILSRYENAPVSRWIIRRGMRRLYYLEDVKT